MDGKKKVMGLVELITNSLSSLSLDKYWRKDACRRQALIFAAGRKSRVNDGPRPPFQPYFMFYEHRNLLEHKKCGLLWIITAMKLICISCLLCFLTKVLLHRVTA